jgi:hypothetical protein
VFVDEVAVISLASRAHRMTAFWQGLPRPWVLPVPRLVTGVSVRESPPWWHASAGAYGCALAHVGVLEDAWKRGVERLLVLEDDACFAPDFPDRSRQFFARVPPAWSLLMLGGQHVLPPSRTLIPGVVRCVDTRRTHAYVVKQKAMPLLIRTWKAASTHIDFSLPTVQAMAKMYAPERWLVGQRNGRSDTGGPSWHADMFFEKVVGS